MTASPTRWEGWWPVTEPKCLAGRLALITGATGGIGRAIADAFAAAGARLILLARDADALEKLRASLGTPPGTTVILPADVTDEEAMLAAASTLRDQGEMLTVLCICAGTMHTGRLDEVSRQTWNDLLSVNLTGAAITIRAFLPLLADPSSVITVASTAGLRPIPGFAAYTVTKAALIHLTQACALDYARRGIRFNCLCPGVVRTPIHRHLEWPSADMLYDTMREATPLGYLGEPMDLAHAALFLADPRSHWITGISLVVDGGLSLI